MRVLDLLGRTELGLSVVWADAAMLEREVKGSYIVDLPDPGKFLSEGDLVLTSGVWDSGPESAAVFTAALQDKGVAVLVVGRIIIGAIPDYLELACRQRGIVLLTVSQEVSFKSISQYIESELSTASDAGTSRSVVVNRGLLDRLGSGLGVQGALRLFYEEFGIECWVLESSGTVSAVAGSAPPVPFVAAVWNRMLGSDDNAVVLADDAGRTFSVWPIITHDGRPLGYLACAGDLRTWPVDVGRVVGTLIVVARVELELANNRLEAEHSQASEFASLLVADSLTPGEASARLRLLGADPLEPVTVVVATVSDEGYPTRAILRGLEEMLALEGRVMIGSEYGAEALLFVSGSEVSPERLIADSAGTADRQRAMLGSRQLKIGVSERTLSVSQLSHAVSSARTRMRAVASEETISWATRSTPLSYDALLALVPERVRMSFGRSLLSPLVDYDARHGSELVQTLRVFLDSGAAWQQAAGNLHVHVNTLRYRVGRIEALTDRDLTTMRDRVDLFLALESLQIPGDATPPAAG